MAQIEAELAANQEDARTASVLALSDADQPTQVLAPQRQVAQKEELIKGHEYDINLVEESGAAEAENATKTIGQLQKELDEKSGEMERLRDQTATLESELGERIKALTTMEEDLVATNANAAKAAIENSNLRARVAGLESQMASLDALVKEEESVIRSLKSSWKRLDHSLLRVRRLLPKPASLQRCSRPMLKAGRRR